MINKIYALRKSLRNYTNGGYVLIAVTVLAMILANSPWRQIYFSCWDIPVLFRIGDFNLFEHGGVPMTLKQLINDALMAIFFFSVGLEIKREVLIGELSSIKKALLPVFAALGGIIFPITIYRILASDADVLQGCAIPMATDIAFSLGILSLFGKRVPIGLKIFLATLAVADDIGGILIIAIFFTVHIDIGAILLSLLLLLILFLGSHFHIYSKIFYITFGVAVWYFFLHSGIHPTIAGVFVALSIPVRPVVNTQIYINEIKEAVKDFPHVSPLSQGNISILTNEQMNILKSIESASDKVISPLQDLEDTLYPIINYFVIPSFVFANAGIFLKEIEFANLFSGVALSTWIALVIGKFLGIMLFSYIPIFLRVTHLPTGVNWSMLTGVAALGGIGFTVSLFIANLSYPDQSFADTQILSNAKLGIMFGSLIAGFIGCLILRKTLPGKAS